MDYFAVLGSILGLICLRKKSIILIDLLNKLFSFIKIPILSFGVLLIAGMYVLTSYLFRQVLQIQKLLS